MNSGFLKHLSQLISLVIVINDDIDNAKDIVETFFESFYEEKTIKESNEMLERYENMSPKEKEGLDSDLQNLDLTEIFDFQDFEEKVKQANKVSSKTKELTSFFDIFQDNNILSMMQSDEDANLDDENPELPTLIQQFNFYQDEELPIQFFIAPNLNTPIQKIIEDPIFNKMKSIGNNVFKQYVLKEFIINNLEIKFDDFIEHINNAFDEECKKAFAGNNFQKMTLSTFKTEILDQFISRNPSINPYNFKDIDSKLKELYEEVNPKKGDLGNLCKLIIFLPSLVKIAESYQLFKENQEVFSKCPFFLFKLIEKNEQIMEYIKSNQNFQSICSKTLSEIKNEGIVDYSFALQPKMSSIKNYFIFLDLLFSIILSYKDQSTNIYNIIAKFYEDDEIYSSLKSQTNNSCVFGEKKEALFQLIFIIDCLKSSDSQTSKFDAFITGHSSYLDSSQIEFDVNNSLELIMNNRQFFKEIIEGNSPIASLEYNYVMSVNNGEYVFVVDSNSVTLEPFVKNSGKLTIEYLKLKLIASSLNITMFESRGDFQFQEIAMKFVSRFQLCEKLKTELKLLSNYYDNRSQAKLTFKLDDNENEEEEDRIDDDGYENQNLSLKSRITQIVNAKLAIESTINKFYTGSMTYFTRENLCLAFSYVIKGEKENFKTIIFSTINKKSIHESDFIDSQINNIFEKISKEKGSYDEKFNCFFKLFSNFIDEALSQPIYKTPKNTSNQDKQLPIVSCKRRIMEKAVTILQYTTYQYLPDLIFDFFYSFQNEMPNYNQMIVCTKDTTINRISCFLKFYSASNQSQKTGKTSSSFKLFLMINPQNLEGEVSAYLTNHLMKYSSEILGMARLILLSTNQSNLFTEIYRLWSIDYISSCKFDYNAKYKSIISTNNTKSYMIYTEQPRTGKSHLVMKTISEKYKNNLYHRIIIDNTTTLTKLIYLLKQAPMIENCTTCYHFSVEGSENEQFTLYIIMLYLFGSLNDGVSSPFVLSNTNETVFFFEFGAHPPMNEEKFIENIFPIGKYMERLTIPEAREFFSLDEYEVIQTENKYSTIKYKPLSRTDMIEVASMIELKWKFQNSRQNRFFLKLSNDQLMSEKEQISVGFFQNPKNVYDDIMSLFKGDWIPKEYQQSIPLISQLEDVSHVIFSLTRFIFTLTSAEQELGLNNCPLRFMALSLAFETAIINCGLPYLYPKKNEIEIDKIRLDRITKWIDNAERILVVTGLNYSHDDSCGVRTIQHINRIYHKQSISEEFGIKDPKELDGLIYDPLKWRELEKDNTKIFQELQAIFSLKRVDYMSTFTLCILCWDKLTKDEKDELKQITNNNREYFKKLRETPNCNFKRHPMFYPKKPSENCKLFIESLGSIFRNQRNLPEIKDETILTHERAVDVIQQYVLSNSLLRTYSLTLHNVEMFLHIVYRIYSKLPIVMMGETGSGKTYSVKFLQEVIGPLTRLEIRCFDGGTEEEDIKQYVRENIEKFCLSYTKEEIKKYQLQIIFFFDEVNTAPCQWFIKDLIIDRFLDGKKLPEYVKFICAMNPKRLLPDEVKQRLRGLEQKHQSELSNLVYKVRQMPESFVPYLFSADAPRALPKSLGDVQSYDDLSEFEKVCEKVIAQKMDIEPLPLFTETKTGIIHFSKSSSYSVCFDFKFFSLNSDPLMKEIKAQTTHAFISRLNAYAGRLLIDKKTGIYKDNSFMSIREPERCVHLMRWFYKKGIYEFSQKSTNSSLKSSELFRKSFMLAFAVTYWLRLSDYKLENQKICDRDMFLKKIIEKWEELIKTNAFCILGKILKPPTFDEWVNDTIKYEQQKYADLFVSDDEGLSKNDALCENIWTTYISLSNNIPLWIIGRPGTSKSLAVNIVLAKLFTGRTISNMPTLVYQTFMCSSDSRSEALISQMNRIAEKSLLLPTKGSITALLLEEIGHADLSPYLPLKCLNHIIDDGFKVTRIENNEEVSEFLPITLIGLSNYKMDSAKLNRGILIIRDELSPEQKKKTALDIFSSTALSLFKASDKVFDQQMVDEFVKRYHSRIENLTDCYHNSFKSIQFIGLRDFYGVIKLVTSVLFKEGESNLNHLIYAIKRNFSGDKTSLELFNYSVKVFDTKQLKHKADPSSLDLIRDNLKEDWSKLKNPLSRHMLLVTEGNSALNLLISELKIKDRLIYADNFSGLPDDEWISNDLKQFAKSMTSGETIIFIGNHPCFNSLYDVFNLRYETIYGDSFALISFAGDSFLVKVHPKFKVIIIMEEKEYNTLPAPFLNRFEKMFLNYNLILSQNKKESSENYENYILNLFPDFKVNAAFPSLKKAPEYYFGCYNQHHFRAITYFNDQMQLENHEMNQLVFLNCQPSKAIVALTKYKNREILESFNETSPLKTSILHLLYFYNKTELLHKKKKGKRDNNYTSLALKLYKYWQKNDGKIPGIQAMLLLPFGQEFKSEDFTPFGELIHIQLTEKINEGLIFTKIKKSMKRCQNLDTNSTIALVEVQNLGENLQQRIFHIQAIIENIRKTLVNEKNISDDYSLHTFILIDMTFWNNDLSFVQSVDWPVIFLDTCLSSNLKPIEKSLKTIDISSMIFTPLTKIFQENDEKPKKKGDKNTKQQKESLIDLKSFIEIVKNDLLLIYTEDKRVLLSASLSNKTISNYLTNFLLYIINKFDCFNICLAQSSSSDQKKKRNDDKEVWFMTFLKALYNPPPSLIEYLSVKLSRVVENIYALITQTILSCADKFSPDLKSEKNINIINFIFGSDLFSLKLQNSITIETPQMYPIEYRYLNPDKILMWQMFQYMWEIVIYDPGFILNKNKNNFEEEEEEEEYKEEEEEEAEKELTPEIITEFFKKNFDSKYFYKTFVNPETIPDSFYAAYILLICPGINVNPSKRDRNKFNNLIDCIKKFINYIYGKDPLSLAKTMLVLLDQTMKSYLATLCQCYIFIPPIKNVKFSRYHRHDDDREDEYVYYIQKNMAAVGKQIVYNIFDHEFKNIIELRNFFSFEYPLIRSLSLEFGFVLPKEKWDLDEMNAYLNILNLYNSLFSMLPPNISLNQSMWKNRKLEFDIENPPKSSSDIIEIINLVLDGITSSVTIDEAVINKIYKNLIGNYATYMSIDIFHGFCDTES